MRTKQHILFFLTSVLLFWSQSTWAQCPTIDYESRSSYAPYVLRGWDTVVNCKNSTIRLDATAFITTAQFNGNYLVESIPYDPPESFTYGTKLNNISIDDRWDASAITIDFPFQFFGVTYNQCTVGDNGCVTFVPNVASGSCPWSYNISIPNTNFPIKKSILCCYEDLYPPAINNSTYGVYKSVAGTFPCRHVCVNWYNVPHYATHDSLTTMQLVFYEGTNIIEMHIQKRQRAVSWNNCNGIIGIIDSTGANAFYAPGRNICTSSLTQEAWRFTPLGTTICNINWYYGTDTSITTGVEVVDSDTTHTYHNNYGSKVAIDVSPTVPTTYTMRMRYFSATGHLYDLTSEVTVGVDKGREFSLSTTSNTCCQGEGTLINIETPDHQLSTPRYKTWVCDDSRARSTILNDSMSLQVQPFTWMPSEEMTRDTSNYYCTVTFKNGCNSYDSVQIVHIRRADSTFEHHICQGEEYQFEGQTFNSTGSFDVPTQTAEGCDYTKTLRLAVHNTDFSIDEEKDCRPYTWIDGETYEESTNTPTFTLPNQYGCDSTVNLNFYFDNSLKALISVVPESATLDLLHIQLKDMSLASTGRTWYFPDGRTDTNVTVYYEFPTDKDSVTFMMVAFNEFNCEDTAYVTVPLLKESIWFPNAFTPGRDDNNHFQIKGIGITSLEVEIYDRRGILINTYSGEDGFWDGTTSDGKECPTGNYVYVAKYTNILNPRNPVTHRGSVLLIR